MAAYLIVYRETPVRDDVAIGEYSRRNRTNVADWQARFGFEPLVAYGRVEALEGSAPDGIVVVRFPTAKDARDWYESPAYQDARPFRTKAAEWRAVIVEGMA